MEHNNVRRRYGPHEVFFACVQEGFFFHKDELGRPIEECSRMPLYLMDPSGRPIEARLNVKILERRIPRDGSPRTFGLVDLDRNELWDGGIEEHRENGEVKLWIGIPSAKQAILSERVLQYQRK